MDLRVTQQGQDTLVTMTGVIDEHSDFAALAPLTGRVRIDLRGVRRLNSFGSRQWVDAIRGLAASAKLTFVACSPAVIDQLNMTYGFLGHAVVESFIGVMACSQCGTEFDQLFDTRECIDLDGLPPVACTKCGRPAALDDDPDKYLLFLRERTVVPGPG